MKLLFCFMLTALAAGCNRQREAPDVDFPSKDCKRLPPFIKGMGYDPARSAFSTNNKKKMGLLLIEASNTDTTASGVRYYQHESWTKAGWLAPIQTDDKGNIFTAPAPFINVLNNPTDKQNIVYKVDGTSAVMTVFAELPQAEKNNMQNPYGILGLTYMCERSRLFASSVAGSSRQKEAGSIYSIDATTGKIADRLQGWDAFGLGICYVEGKRKLYFGRARNSDIYSIALDEDGNFAGTPQLCTSLEGLGANGDDKAKRILFNTKGEMKVEGFEFSFNLIASTEKKVDIYYFRYNPNTEKWETIISNW